MAPIRDGDLLGRGVGPEVADKRTREGLKRRMEDFQANPGLMLEAVAVERKEAWEFMAWFRRLEYAAGAASGDNGLVRGGGSGDGIPLGHEQRVLIGVVGILQKLQKDALGVMDALDRQAGLC